MPAGATTPTRVMTRSFTSKDEAADPGIERAHLLRAIGTQSRRIAMS
jgi:hypothetical protein